MISACPRKKDSNNSLDRKEPAGKYPVPLSTSVRSIPLIIFLIICLLEKKELSRSMENCVKCRRLVVGRGLHGKWLSYQCLSLFRHLHAGLAQPGKGLTPCHAQHAHNPQGINISEPLTNFLILKSNCFLTSLFKRSGLLYSFFSGGKHDKVFSILRLNVSKMMLYSYPGWENGGDVQQLNYIVCLMM